MTVVKFDNVAYSYDGNTPALDGLSLCIEEGEFVCLLGGNGSGKSTFAKQLNALLTPTSGTVTVLDCDTADPAHTFDIRSSVGMVFQNPDDQIVASLVEDDVAFGPQNLGIPREEVRVRVDEALERCGLAGLQQRETSTLSGGQKQRLCIAGALAMRPRILVLDEPTAMLDPQGRSELMRICRELHEEGLTLVLITHFMDEAAQASRIVVLDKGRVALDGTPDDVLAQAQPLRALQLDAPLIARLAHDLHAPATIREQELVNWWKASGRAQAQPGFAADAEPLRRRKTGCGEEADDAEAPASNGPALSLDNVSFRYRSDDPWALHRASIAVTAHEFVGIAGHTGSGKSTFAQLAGGLLQPQEGRVLVYGADLADKRAARMAREKIGIVFQYPEHQLFAATVFDDVAFGPRNLGLSPDKVETRVHDALEAMHLRIDDLRETSPFALSGGQQRRIAIAGVLAMAPSLLILDEPAAGLDPRAHDALLQLVEELHDQQHMAIVFISHNMDDLAQLCDRVVLLNDGAIERVGTPDDVFSDEAALQAIGLEMPQVMHLSRALGLTRPYAKSYRSLAASLNA